MHGHSREPLSLPPTPLPFSLGLSRQPHPPPPRSTHPFTAAHTPPTPTPARTRALQLRLQLRTRLRMQAGPRIPIRRERLRGTDMRRVCGLRGTGWRRRPSTARETAQRALVHAPRSSRNGRGDYVICIPRRPATEAGPRSTVRARLRGRGSRPGATAIPTPPFRPAASAVGVPTAQRRCPRCPARARTKAHLTSDYRSSDL